MLHRKDVDDLFRAILSLKSIDECYLFFEDICTVKEVLDISQRLRAAAMLTDGVNYTEISRATGMSTATISRVNKCLNYGTGGYRTALMRISESESQADGANDERKEK